MTAKIPKQPELDEETAKKIQELQILEQSLQNLMLQKQAFQIELSETLNALSELSETKEEVYKIVGSVMLRAKKDQLIKDLEHKKGLIDLRIKNIEKQEDMLREKSLNLRDSIIGKLK